MDVRVFQELGRYWNTYTPMGERYIQQNSDIPCTELLIDFAGGVDNVWTKESIGQEPPDPWELLGESVRESKGQLANTGNRGAPRNGITDHENVGKGSAGTDGFAVQGFGYGAYHT